MHPLMVMGMGAIFVPRIVPQVSALSSLTKQLSPPGGNRPIISFRFETDGDVSEATGDTGSALVFSKVGEWLSDLTDIDSSEWEIQTEVLTEDVGDPGTWTGSARESFVALSSQRTWTYTKNGNDAGNSQSQVRVTLREIADTGNSTNGTRTHNVEILV